MLHERCSWLHEPSGCTITRTLVSFHFLHVARHLKTHIDIRHSCLSFSKVTFNSIKTKKCSPGTPAVLQDLSWSPFQFIRCVWAPLEEPLSLHRSFEPLKYPRVPLRDTWVITACCSASWKQLQKAVNTTLIFCFFLLGGALKSRYILWFHDCDRPFLRNSRSHFNQHDF